MLAPNALTTVAAVQDALDTGASVTRIEAVINAVSGGAKKHCSRRFEYAVSPPTAPEFYQGTGEYHLFLRRWPIVDVARVRLDQQTLQVINDPTGALYQAGLGDVQRKPQWDEKGQMFRYFGWPMVIPTHTDLTTDPNTQADGRRWNIDVAYTAGYVLPQFILQASLTADSADVSVTGLVDTSSIQVGYQVTGTGIPTGTTVAAVTGSTSLTLSQAATLTTSSVLYFDPESPVVLKSQPPPIVQTGTLEAGSLTVTGLADTSNIPLGATVSGTGILSNTWVTGILGATSLQLVQPPAATGTSSLTFLSPAVVGAQPVPADLQEAVVKETVKRLARPISGLIQENTPGGWQQRFETKDLDVLGDFDKQTIATLDRYARDKRWFC